MPKDVSYAHQDVPRNAPLQIQTHAQGRQSSFIFLLCCLELKLKVRNKLDAYGGSISMLMADTNFIQRETERFQSSMNTALMWKGHGAVVWRPSLFVLYLYTFCFCTSFAHDSTSRRTFGMIMTR